MNLSKNIFQQSTFRKITAAVLATGLSMSLYAADTTASVDPASNVVSQTTKVVTTTTTHVAKHRAHHAKSRTTKMTEVQQVSTSPERPVIWKNGVIFNDVEPTGQTSTPFGAPTSTSDTLQGGVTSTLSPAPTQ